MKLYRPNEANLDHGHCDYLKFFEEGKLEAAATEDRLVTVILPDGNHVNNTINFLETAMQIKVQLLRQPHISLSEYEVVLCKEKYPQKNMVLQDDEEFLDNLFNFDYIEIRSRQQHNEIIQAMESCINWKTPLNSF